MVVLFEYRFFFVYIDRFGEEIPLREDATDLFSHNGGRTTKIVPTTMASQCFIDNETRIKKKQKPICDMKNAQSFDSIPIQTFSTGLNGTCSADVTNTSSNNNNHTRKSLRSEYNFVKVEQELNDMSATSRYDLDYNKEMDTEMWVNEAL